MTVFLTTAASFPIPAEETAKDSAAPEEICEISPAMAPDFVLDARNCTENTSPVSMVQLYRPLEVRQQEFFLEKISPFQFRIINASTGTVLTAEGRSVILKEAEGRPVNLRAFLAAQRMRDLAGEEAPGNNTETDMTEPMAGKEAGPSDLAEGGSGKGAQNASYTQNVVGPDTQAGLKSGADAANGRTAAGVQTHSGTPDNAGVQTDFETPDSTRAQTDFETPDSTRAQTDSETQDGTEAQAETSAPAGGLSFLLAGAQGPSARFATAEETSLDEEDFTDLETESEWDDYFDDDLQSSEPESSVAEASVPGKTEPGKKSTADSGPEYSEAQLWTMRRSKDGSCYFFSSSAGMCLTMDDSYAYNGGQLTLEPFSRSLSQQWNLTSRQLFRKKSADTDAINPYKTDGQYADVRISIPFGPAEEVLTAKTLSSWYSFADDHTGAWSEEELAAYVDSLSAKYNTTGLPRRFRTTGGKEITLYEGSLGWKINKEEMMNAIRDAAHDNIRQELDPIWEQKTGSYEWDTAAGNDIGDSYVEVDLTAQHVWLYKEGELVVSTDCVSGTLGTDRETPGGVYYIFYMQSPDVLDGPGYSSPVTYWMPFNHGIGLHDATWRGSFGGEIYKYDGSHGCINLPLDAAGIIYENVKIGYPVVCYY